MRAAHKARRGEPDAGELDTIATMGQQIVNIGELWFHKQRPVHLRDLPLAMLLMKNHFGERVERALHWARQNGVREEYAALLERPPVHAVERFDLFATLSASRVMDGAAKNKKAYKRYFGHHLRTRCRVCEVAYGLTSCKVCHVPLCAACEGPSWARGQPHR